MTLKSGVELVKIVLGLALTGAVILGGYLGWRHYTRDYEVTTDDNGLVTARVISATLFARSDLRVSRLSGTVQGTGEVRRWWGWLKSSQVIKAPYSVDYMIPLQRLGAGNFRYDEGRRVLFVQVPDVRPQRPNIDLANATLNEIKGVFVSRGAMQELGPKVARSASNAAGEKARSPENMRKARENGRAAIERLFAGALRAAQLDARVEVRFAGEPMPGDSERWDTSRSLQEVLAGAT